jgi:dTDP-4-amino-4,6-dideoxygalactose transaminase
MQVPFVSLQPIHDQIAQELQVRHAALIHRGDFILGEEVSLFEQAYAAFSETRYSLGISNGLDALKIALRALDIGAGDEVIVPAHTYIASIYAILEVGAVPVLAEPDSRTYNVTAAGIRALVNARTKAIMPVHLYGQPCEMDEIMQLATAHALHVVEDNAQAQGASYKGRKTGSFGSINATSFYPSKNLGAMGDAGAITTNDEQLYKKVSSLRNMGSEQKYHHVVQGYNARLDSMQAAVLNCKLPHLDSWNEQRRKIGAHYLSRLEGMAWLVLPATAEGATHVYHLFVIRHLRRDALQQYLQQHGIQTLIHYPVPCHLQPALSHLGYRKGDLPVTEQIAATCLSLPIFPGMTADQVDYVCDKILAFGE